MKSCLKFFSQYTVISYTHREFAGIEIFHERNNVFPGESGQFLERGRCRLTFPGKLSLVIFAQLVQYSVCKAQVFINLDKLTVFQHQLDDILRLCFPVWKAVEDIRKRGGVSPAFT